MFRAAFRGNILEGGCCFCIGKTWKERKAFERFDWRIRVLLDLLDILSGANGRMQRVALTAMKELVVLSAGNQTLLANAGCLELVLHLLCSTKPKVKQCAAEILAAIAWIAEVRRAIVELAGIPMLVEAARVGHIVSRTRAAHALDLLAFRKRFRRIITDADAIPVLVDLVRDGDMAARLVAGNALGILSAHVDHLRPIAQAGAIPLFVDLLEIDDSLGKEIADDAFCILAISEENAIAIADHTTKK